MTSSDPSRHLRFLQRRVRWLHERVANATHNTSFDKAEIAALTWAISRLQDQQPTAQHVKEEQT